MYVPKNALQILAQLGLREQLLKRAQASEHPVAILGPELAAIPDRDAGRHDQRSAAQLPSLPERLRSFLEVFDDIQNVAEIDRVGRTPWYVRPVDRVPAVAVEAELSQVSNVISVAAPEVKKGVLAVQPGIP